MQWMNVEPDALIARAPDCLAADMGEELVIMIAGRGTYLALDSVGRDVWSCIALPCSFPALCDCLEGIYAGARAAIEADVAALLGKLQEAGAVEIRR
ncbi:Coenzyme PQQ synthesis protein D (PqqD) [Paracidovorax cattleyae]|uniref:Coenzyme PQQ synthesis protein D (PqqD) n=2 Tax=Paracidovorax cattleyae TaxID=80868 RepID=A0A1H0W7Q7_9BURK|nr:PqqD family protein [Paracidovorax cattleyae]SDP86455.1 Coenzyme PQQ synthesis protein D (PqqD) [Paracidovorax cattleyae]